MTLIICADMAHVIVVIVAAVGILAKEGTWGLVLLLLTILIVVLHTVLLLAVVAQNIKIIRLLLLTHHHTVLVLDRGRRGQRLRVSQILYCCHEQ